MPEARIFNLLFPEGKKKALTLSYDDGVVQDRRLVALLNKYKIRCTFNLCSGLLGTTVNARIDDIEVDVSKVGAREVQSLYKGHEVAGHGYTHMALNTVDSGSASYEVIYDRKELEIITGGIVRGFAYPFGTFNENVKSVLVTAGIEYARTVRSTREFGLPSDYLEWNPTCHHNDPQLMKLAESFCKDPHFFDQPKLFYLWGHSYEFDQHDNWNVIEDFLDYMSQNKEIWFATNIEIIDYLKSYRQLKYSADGNMIWNPTNTTIWLNVRSGSYVIHPGETITLPA